MTLALPLAAVALAFVLLALSAHLDQRQRRIRLGLPHQPNTLSDYVKASRQRRDRALRRAGIVTVPVGAGRDEPGVEIGNPSASGPSLGEW